MLRIGVTVVVLAAVLTGCGADGRGSSGGSDRVEVVASFYPLAWVAEQVARTNVEVENLTPPGAEPHDFELTARDVERIRSANLILYLGGGFQPAVEDAVQGAEGRAADLLVDPVRNDPHVWLDPRRFATIADRVATAIGDSADATVLKRKLRALDAEYRRGLAHCRHRQLVTAHDAFGYLARRYRLQQVAISGITPESEPTPRQLERVVDRVGSSGATTVFFETLLSPRLAKTVARETGARTDVLNPLEGLTSDQERKGENYLSLMRENLAAIRGALECR